MYLSTRVARSRDSVNSNSSGVSSMNFVWHLPATKVGCVRMLVTNGMFVLTPRTCSSLMARVLRQTAGKGAVPARDLDEQGVIVRRDDRARADVAAVETYAEAAAGAVGLDLAVVGREVVGRVLGGHAALDGVAVDLEVVLVAETDLRVADRLPLGDEDLRTHEVDVCDHLGDGVLDLDAGGHLDEIVVAVAVDEELHRAGVDIADGLGDLHGVSVQLLADALGHTPRGRKLHDLLVAALQEQSRSRGGAHCRTGRQGSAPRCAWAARDISR